MRRRATLDDVEQAMADLARLMRAHGEHGLEALPIFERLEREHARMVDIELRLEVAIARRQSATRATASAAQGSTSE